MPNLKCLVLRHKWRPVEETNEYGLRLACARCGKLRGMPAAPVDHVAPVPPP
jgi:hypothetical protein